MPLEFEFFRYDLENYYAVVSRGNLVYSTSLSSFVVDSSISFSGAAISLFSGNMGRLYGSIPDSALTEGLYVVRIYRGNASSASSNDEIVSMGSTAWSSVLLEQVNPASIDDSASMMAREGIRTRRYAIKLSGGAVGSNATETGLAEIFVFPEKKSCYISFTVFPRISGVVYSTISIRRNDSTRTLLQSVSITDNGGTVEIGFSANDSALGYLTTGNFIFAISSFTSGTPRIGGNPENEIIPSLEGTATFSVQRSAPSVGVSFRTI